MATICYENDHYQVEVDTVNTTDNPYLIINKEHGVIEERVNTKPQALILAKQFDLLLSNNRWEREVHQMYGIGMSVVDGGVPH